MSEPGRAKPARFPDAARSDGAPGRGGPLVERDAQLIDVMLVTSSGCHLCEQAKELLDRLEREYPLRRREVEIESAQGKAILQRHRVAFPPALIINGGFHGYGRVSERKLRRTLDRIVVDG